MRHRSVQKGEGKAEGRAQRDPEELPSATEEDMKTGKKTFMSESSLRQLIAPFMSESDS